MGAVRAGSQKFGGRSRIAPAHFECIRSGGDSRVGCRSTSCSDLCRGGGGTNGSGNGGGGWCKPAPHRRRKHFAGAYSPASGVSVGGGGPRVFRLSLRERPVSPQSDVQ